MSDYDDNANFEPEELPKDAREGEAREELEEFFEKNRDKVFFSRQIEVQNEDKYFHWVTNRALRGLREARVLRSEERKLATGGSGYLHEYVVSGAGGEGIQMGVAYSEGGVMWTEAL